MIQNQVSHRNTVGERNTKIPAHHFPDMGMKLRKETLVEPIIRPEFGHQFRGCTTHIPNHRRHRIARGDVDQDKIQNNNGQ